VSVGNVAQLACDVLISSLNARRVGFLYDDSAVPVVGSEPFISLDTEEPHHHVTTAVEGMRCSWPQIRCVKSGIDPLKFL